MTVVREFFHMHVGYKYLSFIKYQHDLAVQQNNSIENAAARIEPLKLL